MVRPLRIEYPNALYHVISRGNAYQDIFTTTKDREVFLKNLASCINFHNIICHAYCLMNNHYHLLIETPEGNLSKAMRDINGNYTQEFHRYHGTIGHVLQGRYKAYLIEKDTYFLEVARYIANNPVKDGFVQKPSMWKWSSYNQIQGNKKGYSWLETEFTLSLFSEDEKNAKSQYVKFVQDGLGCNPLYKDLKNNFILGSSQFVNWIWENHSKGSEQNQELPRAQRVVGRPAIEEIFDREMVKEERDKAIYFARVRCGYLTTEIAAHLGIDRSTVGKICKQFKTVE